MRIVLNDLYDYGLKIYQDEDNFKFSLDSILLAEFVECDDRYSYVDFCTGNAPVPLILSTKTNAKIYGIELQKEIYNLAIKSIKENNLESNINIINDNIKNVSKYIKDESIDVVTCNPPYFKYNKKSLINLTKEKAIARHEIEMNLEDIMKSAKYILKNKGSLYIVHRCDRLEEIILSMNKYNFSIKKLQFIYTKDSKNSMMVLIKAIKNGNTGSLKVLPSINIMDYKSYKNIFGS